MRTTFNFYKVSKHQRRSGFLLILVIAMLAIITLSTVQLANITMRQAIQARAAEQQLQTHWRNLTLERAAFQHAPALLAVQPLGAPSANRAQAASAIQVVVRIDSKDYGVTLEREAGKLPFGALLERFPPNKVAEFARPLLNPSLSFQVLGDRPFTHRPADLASILVSASANQNAALASRMASQRLSLAGRDKLSLAVTDQETLDALWRILFSKPAPKNLLLVRKSGKNIDESLSLAGLRESELAVARQWVTDRDDTYSVWIEQIQPTYAPLRHSVRWGTAPFNYSSADY